jgi:pimeloyl-ACP methyl ester carboxylesterase
LVARFKVERVSGTRVSELYTASKVRLRLRNRNPGALNWLFVPGGPGIGADSLEELVAAVALPGRSWLVDLPGDGSNLVDGDPFLHWPLVLLEAAQALPDPVFVGHSTGGMYILSVSELEHHLKGLVLISTAPDARWFSNYLSMASENPLPAMQRAQLAFNKNKTNETLRDLAVTSTPWNFSADALHLGETLLARMPYNLAAVEWSDQHFDHTYELKWWPKELPTLILSGSHDRIVEQRYWDDTRFAGENVVWRTIENAGHFPWIEQPDAVRRAFAAFVPNFGA